MNKSQMIQIEMEGVYKEIERLNECIIRLERKKTSQGIICFKTANCYNISRDLCAD